MNNNSNKNKSSIIKRLIIAIVAILFIAAFVFVWQVTPLKEYASPDELASLLDDFRDTPFSVPIAIGIYAIACLIFFPKMALSGAVVLVFEPVEAFIVAIAGSLIAAAAGFLIGKILGEKTLKSLIGNYADKVYNYAQKGGIMAVVLIRMVPIAPYTIVNIALSMSKIPFMTFLAGSFLGLLPGTLALCILGESLSSLWEDPDAEKMIYAAIGVLVWLSIIFATHKLAKKWQSKSNLAKKKNFAKT